MSDVIQYHQGSERPALQLWLLDDDGSLIDFSTGWAFTFKIGQVGEVAALTKLTGITGAVGSGSQPSGTPNVSVDWAAGELAIPVGSYEWQLSCTNSGKRRVFGGVFRILGVIR